MASRKLFVGSLPHNIDEGSLRTEFSKHGTVESIFIKQNCEPGRQWAFVTYASPEQAQNAKQLTDRILTFPGAEKAADVTVARNQGMFGQEPLVPKPVDPMAALGALGMGMPAMAMGVEQPRKIFVGSLPDSVTDAVLRAEFGKFGTIVDLFLKTGCEPGRQWAFITYQSPEQANFAKSSADRTLVVPGSDKACEVMIAKNQGKNGNDPTEGAANASAALFAQNPLAAFGGAFGAQMPFAMPMPAVQWQTYFTTAGQPYYHNASTGVTSWERPPELQTPQYPGALPAPAQQFMGQYAQPAPVAYGAPQYAQYAQPAAVAYGAPQQAVPVAQAAPAALPEGWLEHLDPSSGRSYFSHAATGKTTWDRPQAAQLPAIGNNEGAIGYAASPQQAVVGQAIPAALPEGWLEHLDQSSGRTYFSHAATGKTTWERPQAAPTAAAEVAPSLAVGQALPVAVPAAASAQPVATPTGYDPGSAQAAPALQAAAAAQPAPVAYAQPASHPAAQPPGVGYGAAMPGAPVDPSRVAPY